MILQHCMNILYKFRDEFAYGVEHHTSMTRNSGCINTSIMMIYFYNITKDLLNNITKTTLFISIINI